MPLYYCNIAVEESHHLISCPAQSCAACRWPDGPRPSYRHLAWPDDGDALNAVGFAQAERGYQFALAEIATGSGNLTALLAVLGFQDESRPDGAAVGVYAVALQLEADPVMAELIIVAQYQGGTAIANENHIKIAVAVEVGIGTATADQRLKQIGTSCFGRHWLEALFRLAPEKLRRLLVILGRLQFADAGIEMAIAGQKIEPAIQIVIEEKGPELERHTARPGNAFGLGHI